MSCLRDPLNNGNGRLTAATVNGIPAHRVVARGGTDAVPLYVEVVLFYNDKHRALVSASAMTRGGSGLDPRATPCLPRSRSTDRRKDVAVVSG